MCYDLMKYAQTDNEDEFKKTLLILLKKHDIAIINENLRHPQSQDLVEQENDIVKT